MAIVKHYTEDQRKNISDQIGAIFGVENAGMKMTDEGWRLEGWGDHVKLTVEMVATITKEQAEAILNAHPITGDKEMPAKGEQRPDTPK